MLNIGYHHKKMMWWKNTSHQSCKNLILMQTKCYSTVVHIPIVLSPEYHISPGAYIAAFKCDSLTQTLLSKLCSCWFIRSNSDVLSEPNVLIFFWKKNVHGQRKVETWIMRLWTWCKSSITKLDVESNAPIVTTFSPKTGWSRVELLNNARKGRVRDSKWVWKKFLLPIIPRRVILFFKKFMLFV